MPDMSVDKEKLWASLEVAGERKVRENLAHGIYGERKKRLVEEWLRQTGEAHSEAQQERVNNLHTDEINIARSAKNAAWVAAGAAVIAALAAIWANLS
jgi:hypothetical protein